MVLQLNLKKSVWFNTRRRMYVRPDRHFFRRPDKKNARKQDDDLGRGRVFSSYRSMALSSKVQPPNLIAGQQFPAGTGQTVSA